MRREVVIDLIKKIPGVSYNEIVHETGLSNGVVSHYLIKIMESGEVEKEGIKRGKYFLKNIPKKDRKMITLLRNKTNNDIFKLLLNNFDNEMYICKCNIYTHFYGSKDLNSTCKKSN